MKHTVTRMSHHLQSSPPRRGCSDEIKRVGPTVEPRDAGPPHAGLLCIPGDWLCRYPAGDGHSIHAPYVQGEYLADAEPDHQPAPRDR